MEASARTNQWLAIFMGGVVVWLLACIVRYLLLQGPQDAAFYTRPSYDPATFQLPRVSTGVSIAALTYIGFDSISTLSEEAIDPYRNIMRATVLTCLFTGVLAAVECYAGQLVWPDFSRYPDVDTAYVFIAGRAGGKHLFTLLNATLLLATVGSGTGAMMGCARLLYGMGTGGALPRAFCYVEPRRGVPSRNVLFCGALALIGAWAISYQLGCELLNFGAFLAFLGCKRRGVPLLLLSADATAGWDRRLCLSSARRCASISGGVCAGKPSWRDSCGWLWARCTSRRGGEPAARLCNGRSHVMSPAGEHFPKKRCCILLWTVGNSHRWGKMSFSNLATRSLKQRSRAVRLILAALLGAAFAVDPLGSQTTSSPRQFLDTYCVTCHNQKLRTAGLALDSLDAANPAANAEVWERVIAKLRAGSMPPPGMPRPDAATLSRGREFARKRNRPRVGGQIRIQAGLARSIVSIARNTTTRFATCSRSISM